MQRTIFDNRVIMGFFRHGTALWLRLIGWRLQGELPETGKYVMIAAPHTSNWDFPIMMGLALKLRLKLYWMGKDTLFAGWKGPFARWLGGIAIDRSSAHNVVEQTIHAFASHEKFVVLIPPEGTRGRARKWKTGFYHIASGAGVPIVTGFLDYANKVGGIGPTIMPTGDFEADMARIKSFYAAISGKFPDQGSMAEDS